MHPIAERAINGTEPIATLVRDFYGADGPLAAAGWEIRASQREMSIRFAEQIDGAAGGDDSDGEGSIGLMEAPTGTGKGQAYLVPGFLAALREEKRFGTREPNVKAYPRKLVVSTANIALQSQLVQKDIPALGSMLGVSPRATLMKSRQNYVCRERLLEQATFMYGARDPHVREVIEWANRPGCSGDREVYPGDATEVWGKVSVGSDECGRQSCAHFDGTHGALCFWRAATMDWPRAHIIVGNHHWVALSRLAAVAYAVDEAHELEGALRGVQGRVLSTSTFMTASRRASKLLGEDPDPMDRRMTNICSVLFGAVERRIEDQIGVVEPTSPQYRSQVPLSPGWVSSSLIEELAPKFSWLRDLRDAVTAQALSYEINVFDNGEIVTRTREKTDAAKEARKAAVAANKMAELCRIFGAVVLGRPHPDWPSGASPWAIWAHREKDGEDRWRVIVDLVPADVAPAFGELNRKFPTMLLASATLPEFTSMRLSLGLGTRWVGQDAGPWLEVFKTDTGPYARRSRVTIPGRDRSEDPKPEDDDEPTSSVMATTDQLAPAPSYERRLPSPYPLAQMGVLVVPDGPAPNDARWVEWSTRQVVQAVRQSGGGALVLSTSNAAMKRYADALRAEERWTVIRQGEQGRAKTIAAFKEDEDSVLVGTRSFFQGLDVQGRSCRLVVIDRIPFASPEDPLENAIGRLLVERAVATDPSAQGANAWMLRNVPEAAMVLVQGIGRLIRSQSDRGAVVLLDNRILYSGHGWRILRAAMPPFPLSRQIADVGRVLSGEIVQSLAPPAQRAMTEITF